MSFITLIDQDERIPVEFEKSTIFVRRMEPDEHERVRRRHTRTSYHQGQRYEDIQGVAYMNDVLGQGVLGWEGVHDGQGREVGFSLDLLGKLAAKIRERLVAVIIDREEEMFGTEAAEKNLQSSSSPGSNSHALTAQPVQS